MAHYITRTEPQLAWSESRERLTLQGRQLLRRVLNVALTEAAQEFEAGLHRGDLIEFDGADLKKLLLRAAVSELGAPLAG